MRERGGPIARIRLIRRASEAGTKGPGQAAPRDHTIVLAAQPAPLSVALSKDARERGL
jgi:hypothetical protein